MFQTYLHDFWNTSDLIVTRRGCFGCGPGQVRVGPVVILPGEVTPVVVQEFVAKQESSVVAALGSQLRPEVLHLVHSSGAVGPTVGLELDHRRLFVKVEVIVADLHLLLLADLGVNGDHVLDGLHQPGDQVVVGIGVRGQGDGSAGGFGLHRGSGGRRAAPPAGREREQVVEQEGFAGGGRAQPGAAAQDLEQ